jgi:hypothetical protein
MRPYIWPALVAIIVFLLGSLVVRLSPRLSGQALADTANWASLAVNFIALIFGLFSLVIALAAFRDAQASGAEQKRILDEQKGILDASKNALSSVVTQLNSQRELLNDTLATSTRHVELVEKVQQEEERRLARRPAVSISIQGIAEDQLDERIPLQIDAGGWGQVAFGVTNTGDLDLNEPVVILQVPQGYFVDQARLRLARDDRNFLQFTPERPIRRRDISGGATIFRVDLRAPPDNLRPFELLFRVFGDSLPAVARTFVFVPQRQAP